MNYKVKFDNGRVRNVKLSRTLNENGGLEINIVTPYLKRVLATLTFCVPGDYCRLHEAFVWPWAVEFVETHHLGIKKEDGIFPLYQFDYDLIDR